MDRRQVVACVGGALAVPGVGRYVIRSGTGSQEPTGEPTVTWDSEVVHDRDTGTPSTEFEITVTIKLNGAREIVLSSASGVLSTPITKSGSYTVAGTGTEFGTARAEDWFSVTFPEPVESAWEERYSASIDYSAIAAPGGNKPHSSSFESLDGMTGTTAPTPSHQEKTVDMSIPDEIGTVEDEISLTIPQSLEEYYRSKYRHRVYGSYTSDSLDEECLGRLAHKIATRPTGEKRSDRDTVELAIKLVQNIEYITDKEGKGYREYPKYPTETLLEKEGDCEDTCILLTSLLKQLGYDTVLFWYISGTHMSVGLADGVSRKGTSVEFAGKEYYYVETTASGYDIGESYSYIEDESPRVLATDSSPSCWFRYHATVNQNGSVSTRLDMKNVGDGIANNVSMTIEFQTHSKQTVVSESTQNMQLRPQQLKSTTLTVDPPVDRDLRLTLSMYIDGELHDTSVSEYNSSD